jgi:hypothetical protein
MKRYRNLGGNSNIYAYRIDPSQITVSFNGGVTYVYTYSSAGVTKTEKMKQLAIQGKGLNGFIKTYANNSYAYKFR